MSVKFIFFLSAARFARRITCRITHQIAHCRQTVPQILPGCKFEDQINFRTATLEELADRNPTKILGVIPHPHGNCSNIRKVRRCDGSTCSPGVITPRLPTLFTFFPSHRSISIANASLPTTIHSTGSCTKIAHWGGNQVLFLTLSRNTSLSRGRRRRRRRKNAMPLPETQNGYNKRVREESWNGSNRRGEYQHNQGNMNNK